MNDLKELINILCPKWKPLKEWSNDDKNAVVSFLFIIVLFILGGLIESIPE